MSKNCFDTATTAYNIRGCRFVNIEKPISTLDKGRNKFWLVIPGMPEHEGTYQQQRINYFRRLYSPMR
jgi:hypothetical protein